MAGDWIKMRMDLPEDPAVFKLASILKMDRLSVVGRLYAFWSWADKHAVDGYVDGASSQVVDAVTQQDGFSSALESVKWLQVSESGLTLPRHERHNGESAKERSLKNQRQARWRDKKNSVDTASSTAPSTREEKRREDKTPIAPSGAFLRFWATYPSGPRKKSQGACWEVWRKKDLDLTANEIIAHVEALKPSDEWQRENGRFIPGPLPYLNKKQWEGAEFSSGFRVDA